MDEPSSGLQPRGRAVSLRGHSTATENHSASRIEHRDDGKSMLPYSEDPSSSESPSEELEMDDMDSDNGVDADEETGLTSKERRKAKLPLDVRIGGDKTITKEEKRIADQNVIKRLLANAILIALWYLFSVAISIYNKEMFSRDKIDFHYPLFATSLHMLVQFGLASLILYFFPRFRPKPSTPYASAAEPPSSSTSPPPPSSSRLITPFFYLIRLIPCGTATSLDIGLGNMSLKFITLTFYTMCKSSSLAFVLLFAFLFRLESPSWKLILIIATMTAGVIMMVAGEAAFDALGFALVLAASCFSGFRWALTQILLLRHPATSNPFATLFFLTPIMFLTLLFLALVAEGPAELADGLAHLAASKGPVLGVLILLCPGLIAFCMISSEFALLRRTSVVTLSICGIFKEVLTISAAEIRYGDPLTPINLGGLLVTIASIAAYNWVKVRGMRRKEREEVVVRGTGTETGVGVGIGIGNGMREEEEGEEEGAGAGGGGAGGRELLLGRAEPRDGERGNLDIEIEGREDERERNGKRPDR